MKIRSTTPVSRPKRLILVVVAVLLAVAVPLGTVSQVNAESVAQLQAKINALQAQQDRYQSTAHSLSQKADTLSNKIAKLQNQEQSIQAQIDISQTKYDKLQKQIDDTKQKISDNREALNEVLSDMYVEGDITPLEMLASSKNIGDYLDKQEYQSSISDQLNGTIKKINQLKSELESKQQEVKLTLLNQQKSKDKLAATQAEQQQILRETKGQESSYRNMVKKNQSQQNAISKKIANQMRATITSGSGHVISVGGSGGGYPYNCPVSQYAVSSWNDQNGYGCSQCVSYAAWKMGQKTGLLPQGWGNADMFPGNASSAGAYAAGFRVTDTPRANSIVFFPSGVNGAGDVGHVAWVEAVDGNTITVSQYNYYVSGYSSPWGHYSEMTFPSYGGMQYIYVK